MTVRLRGNSLRREWDYRMDHRNFDEFLENVLHYYQLYEQGLKKQANKYIEDYVHTISAGDRKELNDVLFLFAQELCDIKKYDSMGLRERGNGRIPYALDMLLRDYLYSECLENKMPQLRWFYELYKNDKFGVMYAKDMLERAYLSADCDQKTVTLLFASWLGVLGWGAHHFPEGCIITREEMHNAVEQCKKIMSEKEVDEELIAELHYWELLYQCYYKYVDEGRSKSFQEYCDEAEIEFHGLITVYYQK